MKGDDRPAVGIALELALQPGDLLFELFVGVEGDDADALVVYVIDGFQKIFVNRFFRKGELRSPVMGDTAVPVHLTAKVLVIARSRDPWNHGVNPVSSFEPLRPIPVEVGVVDEIAGVNHEAGMGCIRKGRSNRPRPHGQQVVLGIAEVDEGERLRSAAGGAEVEPFAPNVVGTHPVGVERARLKRGKVDRMEVDRILADIKYFCDRTVPPRVVHEVGRCIRYDDFGGSFGDGGIRSPGDSLSRRRIAFPREDDSIRNFRSRRVDGASIVIVREGL